MKLKKGTRIIVITPETLAPPRSIDAPLEEKRIHSQASKILNKTFTIESNMGAVNGIYRYAVKETSCTIYSDMIKVVGSINIKVKE